MNKHCKNKIRIDNIPKRKTTTLIEKFNKILKQSLIFHFFTDFYLLAI